MAPIGPRQSKPTVQSYNTRLFRTEAFRWWRSSVSIRQKQRPAAGDECTPAQKRGGQRVEVDGLAQIVVHAGGRAAFALAGDHMRSDRCKQKHRELASARPRRLDPTPPTA